MADKNVFYEEIYHPCIEHDIDYKSISISKKFQWFLDLKEIEVATGGKFGFDKNTTPAPTRLKSEEMAAFPHCSYLYCLCGGLLDFKWELPIISLTKNFIL